MLTKPAGVFVQLVAAAIVIAGALQFGTGGNPHSASSSSSPSHHLSSPPATLRH